MRSLILCVTALPLVLTSLAHADDNAALCSRSSTASDADKISACDQIIATATAGARAISNAHLVKAQALFNARQLKSAFAERDLAVKADTTSWEAYDQRGSMNDWYLYNFKDALADLNEAIKLGATNFAVYQYRGDVRHKMGDYTGAIADYDMTLTRAKGASFALFLRGRTKLAMKDYDGAIADLTQDINKKPPWSNLSFARRCLAYLGKGNLDAALADCDQAIALLSTTPSAYASRGRVYTARHEYDKAIADFDLAIQKRANTATFYAGRGEAFEGKKDFDNARADYQIATAKSQASFTADDLAIQDAARARLQKLPPPQKDGALPSPSRVALVIGNGAYKSVPALPNPPKDANAVAKTLESVGFTVVKLADDMPRDGFLQALRIFSRASAHADWAVVYYAGHGMEIGGVNYLIPVDAKLNTDKDAEEEAVSLELVMAAVAGARKMRLVMLDACRDNPFAEKMQRTIGVQLVGKGLSNIEPDSGTMIVYATRHGQTAMDGNGAHSPFATAVMSDLPKPGIEVRRLFDVVRDDVMKATDRAQQPFSYGSLPGNQEFYFVAGK